LTGTPNRGKCGRIPKSRKSSAAFCVSGAYDWRKDAIDSFHLALHFKALALGAKRFSTISEMYHQESHGVIP
jgi:hypothetical protein